MTIPLPPDSRKAALAAVQAWLRAQIPDPAAAGDALSPEGKVEGARLVRLFTEVLAPAVLRLAERCAREGINSVEVRQDGERRSLAPEAIVLGALTAEDRGTDG